VFIVPLILSLYAIRQEKERFKARFGPMREKEVLASDPVGTGPHPTFQHWDAKKAVEDYRVWMESKRKKKE